MCWILCSQRRAFVGAAYLLQLRLFRLLVLIRFGCLPVELLGRELHNSHESAQHSLRLSQSLPRQIMQTLRLNSAFSRPDMVSDV